MRRVPGARRAQSFERSFVSFVNSPLAVARTDLVSTFVTASMLTRVYSAALQGVDAIEIEVEVNTGSGDPKVVVVGLPDVAVKESKDRVTTALANSGYRSPRLRTTINLAPADIKKEGPSFDLPIAIGMIAVANDFDSISVFP